MAQLVEHNLAKVGVAGSSPVFRSMLSQEPASQSALLLKARGMATWPSGKAEACKAFITGSIPVVASSKRKGPGNPGPCFFWWPHQDSNLEPVDYESIALTIAPWGQTTAIIHEGR